MNFSRIKKITVGIILYKNTKYLSYCLQSLLSQTYKNFELLLRDQDEGSFEALHFLQSNYPEILKDKRVRVFSGKNLWHSAGHNFLFSQMADDSDAYLCASNDMVYELDCIEKLVNALNKNKEYSVVVPKLKRWDFQTNIKTNFIDSCGIGFLENHHFYDIGQGEEDRGQYDEMKEIFGGSGALFLARKSLIQEVGFFDEYLHYKNDIDLAYRFQWAGAKTCFIPLAVAFHDRQVGNASGNMGRIQKIIKNNKDKPLWVKESSFLGHLVLLYKNVYGNGFPFVVIMKIFWYVFRATGFLLLTTPQVLLQYKKFYHLLVLGNLKEKKKKINVIKKKTAKEILSFCTK